MSASSVAESIINFFGVGKGVFSTLHTPILSALNMNSSLPIKSNDFSRNEPDRAHFYVFPYRAGMVLVFLRLPVVFLLFSLPGITVFAALAEAQRSGLDRVFQRF